LTANSGEIAVHRCIEWSPVKREQKQAGCLSTRRVAIRFAFYKIGVDWKQG
jgi:hypothetical protein